MEKHKIAITGPESCGKSTISEELAAHYQTAFSSEYAREYLSLNENRWDAKLIEELAKQQIKQDDELLTAAHNYLFCDTDLLNFQIWLEHEKYEVPDWIIEKIKEPTYSFTLLMQPDIPWEADSLRMFPEKRAYFFQKFESLLKEYELPYAIVDGSGSKRLRNAITVIDSHFSKKVYI